MRAAKILLVISVFAAAAFLVRDVGLGFYRGYREGAERGRRVAANRAAFQKANTDLAAVKQSIAQTRLFRTKTPEDIADGLRVAKPEVALWRQSLDTARGLLLEIDRDATAARDPVWKELGPLLQKGLALDSEQLGLVERQTVLAESVFALPPGARASFFAEKIRPLLDAEAEIEAKKAAVQQELDAARARLTAN